MRVLVLEDNRVRRAALVSILASLNHTMTIAECASAEDALVEAQEHAFDVAFVDVGLPGMDGVEFATRLQRMQPRVNLVFCTTSTEFHGDALALHCSGYLVKPVTAEQVQTELEHLRFPVTDAMSDDANGAPSGVSPSGNLAGTLADKPADKTRAQEPPRLFMRCFGNFEAFHRGSPIAFGLTKSKELLAYLVCQRGAMCTVGEVEAALWENLPYVSSHQSYLRHLVADLSATLTSLGCANTLVRRRGSLGVDPSTFECDYYDFLDGKLAQGPGTRLFMSQYSWAERIQATLDLS